MGFPKFFAYLSALGLFLSPMSPSQATTLQKIRVKSDIARTDLVLDLDQALANVLSDESKPGQINIQFDAHLAEGIKNAVKSLNQLTKTQFQFAISEQNGQSNVQIKTQADKTLKVYTLDNPNRLIISIRDANLLKPPTAIAPGVNHQRLVKNTSRGPLNINIIDIDPNMAQVQIQPVLASETTLHGKAKVSQIVSQNGGIAGINAAFFKPDTGTSLGTLILNHELIAGPLYNRVSLGMTQDNQLMMSRISIKGRLYATTGETLTLHNVNQPRLTKNESLLYTPRWGTLAPNTPANCVQIQISNNTITNISSNRQSIPNGGYVIIAPAETLQGLQIGQSIGLEVYTTPDWSNMSYAISGGPYLVKNGQIYVDAADQKFRSGGFLSPAPRTAIGLTANNHLIMVTVDGRQKGVSVGVTLSEMAGIMRDLGAKEAMNLDGGSSTQMVVKGQIVNSPSVAGGARVSSALIIKPINPTVAQEIMGSNSPLTP